jgi:hypothetical protein
MVIIEEANQKKLKNSERRSLEEAPGERPTQKIIYFESGCKALEKARLGAGKSAASESG